jgi:hypothetical protein
MSISSDRGQPADAPDQPPPDPTARDPGGMSPPLPSLARSTRRDPDLDASIPQTDLPAHAPPDHYLRILVNPFLAIFAGVVWLGLLLALMSGAAGLLTPVALILLIASIGLLPHFVQFHCLDCGATGPYGRWRRHLCPKVAERRLDALPRRFRGPSPIVQIILWFWIFALVIMLLQHRRLRGAEATQPQRLAARWIGQDGHDFVGPSSELKPSGVQDIHIRLQGLPRTELESAVIKGFGGDEWQVNGRHGPWKAHMIRQPGAAQADLYMEPTRVETGRQFTIELVLADGRKAEIMLVGGKARPDLRMEGSRLTARWIGLDGRDRAGAGPSVGPDGFQDAVIALGNLATGIDIRSITLKAPDRVLAEYGTNPRGHPSAELIRADTGKSEAELFFQPDKDRSRQTLSLSIVYANNTTDAAQLAAGAANPREPVSTPVLPEVDLIPAKAHWLGHEKPIAELPGAVSVAVEGLPRRQVVGAALCNAAGNLWVGKRDGVELDAGTYPQTLVWTPGATPTSATLSFIPVRDETGEKLWLRLLFADKTSAVVALDGGPADLSLRSPRCGSNTRDAHPGDDLQALVPAGGILRLKRGSYRLVRPLVLEQPIRIEGEPGATIVFEQPPDAAPWTTALKIHAGNTAIEKLRIEFAGPVRWDREVSYGPAVIGTTDNRDTPHADPKSELVYRDLDIEGPPPATDWEEAPRLFRLVSAASGRIENCRLRGGAIEIVGGPWTIERNTHLGCHPGAFAFSVISGHRTHDLAVKDNQTQSAGPSGKTWRFLVLTNGGYRDLVSGNTIRDIGPRDDDTRQDNAPEIILSESYRLRFEGLPLAVSRNRHVLAIPDPQGGPAEPGDVLAILSGPAAGQHLRIAQRIDRTTYLLDRPFPGGVPLPVISITDNGFVGEVFEKNTIEAPNSAGSAGFMLSGNLFDTKVLNNTIRGSGVAIRIVAPPTEHPGPWGWSHAPVFDLSIAGNTIEDPANGASIAVEHGEPVKTNVGRMYMTASVENNVIRVPGDPSRRTGEPVGFVIGDHRGLDDGELHAKASENRREPAGRPGVSTDALRVESGVINGKPARPSRRRATATNRRER